MPPFFFIKMEENMRLFYVVTLIFYFLFQSSYATPSLTKSTTINSILNETTCVACTHKDNLCITPKELKVYYKRYKEQVLNEVGEGNWYFTLADLIQATKLLMFEKILYNEAKKSNIEKTKYFEKYKPQIEKEYKDIEKRIKDLVRKGKISKDKAQILEQNLKESVYNFYLKRAYVESQLEPYLKVTTQDIDAFLQAHKGKYGLKKDPKYPNMRVVSKDKLIEIIKAEKVYRVADQFSKYLWNSYNVTINKTLLKQLDKNLNSKQ